MKVNPSVIFREEFDNTALLFNPDDGACFGLNSTGVILWREAANGSDFSQAVAQLKSCLTGEIPETLESDAREFFNKLAEIGFVSEL